MNSTIETLLNHRSIRKFKDDKLSREQISAIVSSAQMASTSSYIQAYSIIGVSDKETKAKLAELAGDQPYVEKNGHFMVFCADLHRHVIAGEMEQTNVTEALESTEKFMVAVIDASLAAQNAAVAAESMNLGICYIGGLRNNIEKVSEILKLPEYVIPLFGMAIGIPDTTTDQKPRLQMEAVYFEEEYPSDEKLADSLHGYNEICTAYYEKRTGGKRKDRWTEQMSRMLSEPKRMHMKNFVEKKGFLKS